MSLIAEFVAEAPSPLAGATLFARALMVGDPASFKAGYTAENAYLAAAEALDRADIDVDLRALAESVGADARPCWNCGAPLNVRCCEFGRDR